MQAQPYRRQRTNLTVEAAVAQHERTADATLPLLRTVQAANGGFLGKPALGAMADALGVNDARVYGIASFSSLLAIQPRAAKVIRICDGPVCMLQGAGLVRAAIEAAAAGGEWEVERCSCLGLC